MKFIGTGLPGVLIVEPKVFADARGDLSETYSKRLFEDAVGHGVRFVQENQSRSSRGVLRGLHCQLPPHEQGKLVRVIAGHVMDVVLDLRPESPTCGRWIAEDLSSDNRRQLWVPEGLAHGFLVLSESADMHYKLTDYYTPAAERCVRWDDPAVGIAWPDIGGLPLVSQKDQSGKSALTVLEEIRAAQLHKSPA